jgi:energy-coupling factor transporter ATP-binding protein EcfA2
MKTLIYVHGTNGSGKSTLARAVLTAAGGLTAYVPTHSGKQGKAGYSVTPREVVLLGAYVRACGGVDGFSPYAHIHQVLAWISLANRGDASVFAEGLITPGVETCQTLASHFDRAVFVVLNTPPDVCIANVLTRRARKGNTKPYTPEKLHDKHRSALRWGDRLEAVGLEVFRLDYDHAYSLSLELLGLPLPSVEDIL